MSPWDPQPVPRRIVAWSIPGVLALVSLKAFYSRAGPDDLAFILAPTAYLTETLSGVHFEAEAGTGWVSHIERVVLGKPCAGVNFMIVALATLYFPFVHRLPGVTRRVGWLGATACLAYLMAVVANSLRLVAAMALWRMDIYGGLVTPERVHRAAGIIIYCLSVLAAYLAAARLFGRLGRPGRRHRVPSVLVPLGWYAGVALGVPAARLAWRAEPARFAEHAALVVIVAVTLAGGVALLRAARRRACINGAGSEGGERRTD